MGWTQHEQQGGRLTLESGSGRDHGGWGPSEKFQVCLRNGKQCKLSIH